VKLAFYLPRNAFDPVTEMLPESSNKLLVKSVPDLPIYAKLLGSHGNPEYFRSSPGNPNPLSFPIPSPALDGNPRSYPEPDTNNTERENWISSLVEVVLHKRRKRNLKCARFVYL